WRRAFCSPTPSPTAPARPTGGPPRARSTGRPGPARAAWPWLGQPRLSAAFPCAVGLPAHVERPRPRRRDGEELPRSESGTRLGGRPTSSAIVGHAGAIWTGTVLPSAAPRDPNASPSHGRATGPGVPILPRGRADPRPTDFATRFPGRRPSGPIPVRAA